MTLTMKDIAYVEIVPTNAEVHGSLPMYDHTTLNSVNTCPRYGVIRRVHHLTPSAPGSRAMALEAGKAAHEAFAAVRMWQVDQVQGYTDHADYWGRRLFRDAYDDMRHIAHGNIETDRQAAFVNYMLTAFEASGFYDDPDDKRRTVTNIEEALIVYADRVNLRRDIYIHDINDPTAPIGVEMPVDVVVSMYDKSHDDLVLQIRYVGRADGLCWLTPDTLALEDNKTASRINDAWTLSQWTSHQFTGYCVGISAMINRPIEDGMIHGLAIPLPRSYDYGGIVTEYVKRTEAHTMQWLAWILHTVQIIDTWRDDPVNAPMNTGSCNKFFRPCSMIPLCAAETAGEREDIMDQMHKDEWNPLDEDGESTNHE